MPDRNLIFCWTCLISGYAKLGSSEDALNLFTMMLDENLLPESDTMVSVLSACSSLTPPHLDKWVKLTTHMLKECSNLASDYVEQSRVNFDQISDKGKRSILSWNLAIALIDIFRNFPRCLICVVLDGYFKKGDMMRAHDLWQEMESMGVASVAVAFSAFIDGLSKGGFVEKAYDMFLKMTSKGLLPNNFAYNSLISGFCNCGNLDEAWKLEMEMRERGLIPDLITFNIIIKGFCRQERMTSAMNTYIDMHRNGFTADTVTYNTLISGFCKQFDMLNAKNWANRMESSGWGPDVITYNTQIHGYCRSKRMDQAIMMFDDVISSGIVPDTVTHNPLMNGICHDILDHAMILTAKLLKISFVPDLVTINLLLSNLRKQGLPQKTVRWFHKLREIEFEFDEITCKILDKADRDLEEDVGCTEEITGNITFIKWIRW
ncbi:hypothetical protein MIMGU_mgv1a006766mg [Erythranthe guttata]|uniref:Pentacotripeptide-repeat region of PRORP domain-containing protein n=2 Tax=Erythranthe guttata TaxID=4155 RepID=A0A022RMB2_ERYGU|nr:hypothetical protein MIMGU_mgv1a006766mg [Erythranthe guttata]